MEDNSLYLSGCPDDTCFTSTGDIREEDTFKILIASDIHLGFCDDNPTRENDSFVTFEEILQLGRDENVDFVLLGGDLFHDNKPKPATLQRAIEIMRKYCLGSKAIEFEYLGDPSVDFPHQDEPEVNFMNPDINIAMPVFTIHGNHDDPVGTKKTSAVDHLVAAKLLNHFGQWDDLNKINVKAVPFIKGNTKLALFGLGNLKDERLYRLIRDNHVKFIRPKEANNEWFNIFVLHQNRAAHGPKNYIPESFIPHFFDLAIWGHEHECRIDPEPTTGEGNTFIIQPGSPVATSLCPGEAREKHVGILSLNRRRFKLQKKKLETVRPMMLADFDLRDILPTLEIGKDKEPAHAVEAYIESEVEKLIEDAAELHTGNPLQPTEPLVRVRIFHENDPETFQTVRFAQKFSGRIVNEDIVMFKKAPNTRTGTTQMDFGDMENEFRQRDKGPDLDSHVEAIVEAFFKNARENGDTENILEILSERGLSEAVKASVEKDDKEAISLVVDQQLEAVCRSLIRKEVTDEDFEEQLENFRKERLSKPEEDGQDAFNLLRSRPTKKSSRRDDDDSEGEIEDDEDEEPFIEDDDDDDDDNQQSFVRSAPPARGKTASKSRANGASSSRGRGRGRGKNNDDSDSPGPARGGRGSRSRGGPVSSRGRGRGGKKSDAVSPGGRMIQTTLNVHVRKSPRKGGMVFDVSDSD